MQKASIPLNTKPSCIAGNRKQLVITIYIFTKIRIMLVVLFFIGMLWFAEMVGQNMYIYNHRQVLLDNKVLLADCQRLVCIRLMHTRLIAVQPIL